MNGPPEPLTAAQAHEAAQDAVLFKVIIKELQEENKALRDVYDAFRRTQEPLYSSTNALKLCSAIEAVQALDDQGGQS